MEAKKTAQRSSSKKNGGIRKQDVITDEEVSSKGSLSARNNQMHEPLANRETSTVSNAARDWFKNLSHEERAFATGFTDGPFLHALLSVASPWSPAPHGHSGIDWGKMVSVGDFKSHYLAFESSAKSTPKLANKKAPGPSANQNDADSSATQNDVLAKKGTEVVESNAYRIPSQSLSDETFTFLKRLFDEIAVVFPSAFNLISNGDERHPHVILRADYFDGSDDTELLAGMDRLLDVPFLSFDNLQAKTEPMDWLRRISQEVEIPLYALVVARMEWAVRDAYMVDLRRRSGQSVSTKDSSQMLSLVSDLFSHCQSFANILSSTITVSRFLAPILEVCSVKRNNTKVLSELKTESALLMPLPLLVRGCDHKGPVDLQLLDKAVAKCVKGLDDHLKAIPEINAAEFELEIEKEAAAQQAKDHSSPTSSKKKKKRKKRKKKSASNGEKNTPTNSSLDGTGTTDQQTMQSGAVVQSKSSSDDARSRKESGGDEVHDVSSFDSEEDLVGAFAGVSSFAGRKSESVSPPKQDSRVVVASTGTTSIATVSPSELGGLNEEDNHVDDGDTWETVEVRPRSNRKKAADRVGMGSNRQSSFSPNSEVGGPKKPKTSRPSKPKKAARKMVRDILFSVIDSVEDEAHKLKPSVPSAPRTLNSWKTGTPRIVPEATSGHASAIATSSPPSPLHAQDSRTPKTMRDVVAGTRPIPQLPVSLIDRPVSPLKRKNLLVTVADQNTAPTYQETVSAVSASSTPPQGSKSNPSQPVDRKSDSRSGETDEAPQNSDRAVSSKAGSGPNSSPPLPTLLSPENAYSATSSVASSLEAPHAGQGHHRSVATFDADDVGCHLLDVCDRLSQDMSLFMSRRALALSIRRRERGALVAALQDTVSSIWPGRCHAELYGSCATQLDLPASDIDVVVLGLDRVANISSKKKSKQQSGTRGKPSRSHSLPATSSADEDDNVRQKVPHRAPSTTFPVTPTNSNAERVVRLAAELEKQPWAVQVRAIPTATVPVIKVLADPSRLVSTSAGGAWMAQHQHMAAEAAAAAGKKSESGGAAKTKPRDHESYGKNSNTMLQWRGSDVMKGLLSLDITFEGLEHGGLGSTQFSTQVVKEACKESGLHPDQTAFVQVLMVVKELLAQRKLNEPYSGGLSSYASLLLVLGLVQERAVIRAEIDQVEHQKRAMAAAELSPMSGANCSNARSGLSATKNQSFANAAKGLQSPARDAAKMNSPPSSWANVAKQTSGKVTSKDDKSTTSANDKALNVPTKKPSFADAVARSPPATPGPTATPISGSRSQPSKLGSGTKSCTTNPASDTKIPPKSSSKDAVSEQGTAAETTISATPQFYPQGYNDIVEVLCSGETTAGKLLMHFLLFYGQHFDAQSTAIDISRKHERHFYNQVPPYSYMSPYIQRHAAGNIDPVTGMLTVDPIVVYDPLEGAENNNVARRCFAWNQVRWIFGQSYNTLASAVERSATPPTTPSGSPTQAAPISDGKDSEGALYSQDGDMTDTSSSLLRCLLSF